MHRQLAYKRKYKRMCGCECPSRNEYKHTHIHTHTHNTTHNTTHTIQHNTQHNTTYNIIDRLVASRVMNQGLGRLEVGTWMRAIDPTHDESSHELVLDHFPRLEHQVQLLVPVQNIDRTSEDGVTCSHAL